MKRGVRQNGSLGSGDAMPGSAVPAPISESDATRS